MGSGRSSPEVSQPYGVSGSQGKPIPTKCFFLPRLMALPAPRPLGGSYVIKLICMQGKLKQGRLERAGEAPGSHLPPVLCCSLSAAWLFYLCAGKKRGDLFFSGNNKCLSRFQPFAPWELSEEGPQFLGIILLHSQEWCLLPRMVSAFLRASLGLF